MGETILDYLGLSCSLSSRLVPRTGRCRAALMPYQHIYATCTGEEISRTGKPIGQGDQERGRQSKRGLRFNCQASLRMKRPDLSFPQVTGLHRLVFLLPL